MFPSKSGAPPAQTRAPSLRRKRGFALVTVVWGLSIITLLILSFATTSSLRLKTASNIAGAAQAGLSADAAVNMAILSLVSEQEQHDQQAVHDGKPIFCSLEGVAVAVAIEDESGKIDLNSSTPQILNATFVGLGLEMSAANALTEAIIDFRTQPPIGAGPEKDEADDPGRPFHAKHALFATTLELDQVAGVDPALFSKLLRVATVYSYRPGVDAKAAPPALFAALAGFSAEDVRDLLQNPFPNNLDRNDARFPQTFKSAVQGGGASTFLVHAETLSANGQVGAKDAIVDFRPIGNGPFILHELRAGAPRHLVELRAAASSGQNALQSCKP